MLLVLAIIVAYLLGSIPFGLIYGNLFYGKDIRKQGSGNIGASNALRLGGTSLGVITLLSDFAKGVLAIQMAEYMGISQGNLYYVGFTAIIGHIFPVWLQFEGGKGIATTLSVIFMLSPWCAINLAIIWGGVFYKTKTSSLASIVSVASFILLSFIYDIWFIFMIAIVALMLYTHRENVYRLLEGKELNFKK